MAETKDQQQEIMERLRVIEKYTLIAAKNVLNPEEAADYIGISKSHLYHLTSTNAIPHYKPRGKQIYFAKVELDAWMQQGKVLTYDEAEAEAADYLNGKGDAQ